MNKSLISIIVPIYNVEDYLSQCLDSIIAQTYPHWECVLVDDGSKDESGRICDEYAARDKRFVVVHKLNEGVAKARITAFEHSKGELITFIDSDDYVSPEYLLHLYDYIIKYDVDVSCCQSIRVKGDKETRDIRPEIGYFDKGGIKNILKTDFLFNRKTYISGMPLYLWGKLVKRQYMLDALHAGDGLWFGEDMVGVFILMLRISSICISDECHYFYVDRDNQATKVYDRRKHDANIKVCNRLSELDKNKYLEEQLSQRFNVDVYNFLALAFNRTNSYSEFKRECDYVTSNVASVEFPDPRYVARGLVERLLIWSLQKKIPYVYYAIRKLWKLIPRKKIC
jgi:glycosyltransferase involved in cell wall biosynthesis